MTRSATVVLNGDTRKFAISDEIKRYAMIDVGFVQTKNGNFVYDHPLYLDSPYNANLKIKITINEAMDKLSMVITDKNGLKKVDIFQKEELQPVRELLDFVLKDMFEKQILEEVN